jgi:NADPH-dependent curcumin reductase CurA
VGDFLYGFMGWQDYAVVKPSQILSRIPEPVAPLSAYAGVLGINGITAWLALKNLGRPAAGETLLVSTAAGAVGSIVGQLAKAAGCRTIGLTSGAEKIQRCLADFGYHLAFNYKSEGLRETVGSSSAAPPPSLTGAGPHRVCATSAKCSPAGSSGAGS